MAKKHLLNILFIGNSHTYYNDMPLMVQERAIEAGYDCRITMIAHGGWYLDQHANEPEEQLRINEIHNLVADEIGALVAPVGENWWGYKDSWPDIKMYAADGEHASERGSDFAAKMLWETIRSDIVWSTARKERQIQ